MRPNIGSEQGRAYDEPMPEWNWGFIGMWAGGWLVVILAAAAIWAWGWPFFGGMALAVVALIGFEIWGVHWAVS